MVRDWQPDLKPGLRPNRRGLDVNHPGLRFPRSVP
ncbi:hypothetical protein METEAL_05860 [Mesoterricola silvestris]|uniref:Uncharacterized protein n=1 Tax=Mesoterricola silvestris TaxID=2927979 RepID=A0AA48GHN2_9BACT|nr:hypothetical protein METEAL_05860 [Mesoterricola silvestris]